ncbi:hypothetical protein ACOSQ3_005070 [Xanthoceras sorbifolium]
MMITRANPNLLIYIYIYIKKKAFSFGHPDVDSIIHRFLSSNPQLHSVVNELELERKRGQVLDEMRKASRKQCWWEGPIDELGLYELHQLRMILVDQSTNPPVPFFKVDDAYDYETKPNETSVASNVYRYGYGIL